MNNKGSLMDLPINLLMIFMAFTFLTALIPAFSEMLKTNQQSTSLNCAGYVDATNPQLSYNSTMAAGGQTSTIGCLGIKLVIPFIVLGVLISGVTIILYGRSGGQQQQQQYG